ncbi:RecX family transcriptional regulator [Aquibaculum arenosum]|uniref:Regulatory protein RecX n=1 Tax=Aquibaculum arenosum TaxID=3032591 RepID=A0ABT5YKN9_9PROT|nr:RecX family transcriptional regulator [Fodinicurvata sp. CAU 1616]MDF2095494.1 RecX family transcriptional regulator [Fodinicurvata sp. CAU 1616]
MSDKAKTRRRAPRKATPDYLERAALFYLERYASSSSSLRRVLLRKVARSAEAHGTDPAEGAAAVESLITRLQERGLVNDAAFAESRARALRRRGASAAGVRARLATKGITGDLAQQALAAVAQETPGDEELAAAIAFARRRRLGPWRAPEQRAERRQRDLAALGRQGFPGTLARRVIDAEDPEALEQQLAETRED